MRAAPSPTRSWPAIRPAASLLSWRVPATTAATVSSRPVCWPGGAIGCGSSRWAIRAGWGGARRRGAGAGEGRARGRQALAGAAIMIDALFGAGLDRPLAGPARQMVEAMNASGAPILAVDLASGVNGTTGAVMGAAVRASRTVTFFRRKVGHLLLPGRVHCGPVQVADIGIKPDVLARIQPRAVVNDPALWRSQFPFPRIDGHKYSRGHAVVVSGSMSTTGAARLAGRAALRAGAGLVTIASPRAALPVHAAANTAVMVRPVDGAEELRAFLADRRLNAGVLGAGGGARP